jgi:hypothetical protein
MFTNDPDEGTSLRTILEAMHSAIDSYNVKLENGSAREYHRIIYLVIKCIQWIFNGASEIFVKFPLVMVYALTLTPVYIFQNLSMALMPYNEDDFILRPATFVNIITLVRKKLLSPFVITPTEPEFDDPLEEDNEDHLGGSAVTDLMFNNIYQVIKHNFNTPLPEEGNGAIAIVVLMKIGLFLYSLVVLPVSFALMLFNIYLAEKIVDRVIPYIAQYILRSIFNTIVVVPLLLKEICSEIFNKVISFLPCFKGARRTADDDYFQDQGIRPPLSSQQQTDAAQPPTLDFSLTKRAPQNGALGTPIDPTQAPTIHPRKSS